MGGRGIQRCLDALDAWDPPRWTFVIWRSGYVFWVRIFWISNSVKEAAPEAGCDDTNACLGIRLSQEVYGLLPAEGRLDDRYADPRSTGIEKTPPEFGILFSARHPIEIAEIHPSRDWSSRRDTA
jgi:hypothetical protein